MSKLTVLNDLHIGAIRSSGTTPFTAYALRKYLLEKVESLLPESDLLLNGDTFDTANVPLVDLQAIYTILAKWLQKGYKLYNAAGNHDLPKSSDVYSSYDFLSKLLDMQFPGQHITIKESTMTPYGYVIPHIRNQALFDLELAKVPECDFLFLHCNVDNNFAVQSDQSLNITTEQINVSKARQVIVAHEHNYRKYGKVLIPGNQFGSSVADWVNPADKFFAVIEDGVVSTVRCTLRAEEFIDMDWQNVSLTDHKFVRISGTASADEASKAINAVNKLRKEHKAFVVTNAVTVQSEDSTQIFEANLESVQSFSVWDTLKLVFTPEEFKVLESLPK